MTPSPPLPETPDCVLARAAAFGVDLSLLRESVRLTPAERLARHQRALPLVLALRDAREPRRP